MAAMPETELAQSLAGLPCLIGVARIHDESTGESEYTQRHREAWSLLVGSNEAESLIPQELSSWLRLWGRFGGELYRAFRHGDDHIRADMIARARQSGSWRGKIVSERLDGWRRAMAGAVLTV